MKKPTYRFQKRVAEAQIGRLLAEIPPPQGEWDLRGIKLSIQESDQTITAWSDGVLIGFASADIKETKLGLIWLFVRSDWRRQGIGTQLLDTLFARFPEAVTVDVIANQAAASFYRSCGFVPAPYVMPMVKVLRK